MNQQPEIIITAIANEETILVKAKRGRKPSTTHYILKEEFMEEIRIYYETDEMSRKLGNILLKLVDGLAHNPKFINYSWIDDMKGDAMIKIMKALRGKNFALIPTNSPFAYFNTIAWRAFITRIYIEKERGRGENSFRDFVFREFSEEFGSYNDETALVDYEHYDESKGNGLTDEQLKADRKNLFKGGRRKKDVEYEYDKKFDAEQEDEFFEKEVEKDPERDYFFQNSEE